MKGCCDRGDELSDLLNSLATVSFIWSLFSARLRWKHRATRLRVEWMIGSLVSGFVFLRLVALCTAALAAGPPATSAIISGGKKNPFYITHGAVFV